MITILSSLLFCISANMDNAVIGIAYGTKKIKIQTFPILCIALSTSIITFLSMFIGKFLLCFISLQLANQLGAILLMLLGFYYMIQNYHSPTNRKIPLVGFKNSQDLLTYASQTDKDHSQCIDFKEAIAVSLSLALNDMGIGIIASAAGMNIALITFFTFICSLLFLYVGIFLGKHLLGNFLGKYASLFSGLLLILLGIIEYIQ